MSWLSRYIATYRGLPRRVWILALVVLVNRMGTMVIPFLGLYVNKHLGADLETVGRVLAAQGLGAVLGIVVGGALVDRAGARRIMVLSLMANAVGFVALRHIDNLKLFTLAVFAVGLVSEAFRPANSTAIASSVPPRDLDKAYGLLQVVINLGMSVGSSLGGVLAAISYATLFYVDAATCLAAAVVAVVLLGDIPRAEVPQESAAAPQARRKGLVLVVASSLVIAVLFLQLFTTAVLFHGEHNGYSERQIGALLATNTVLVTLLQMPAANWIAGRSLLRILGLGSLVMGVGFATMPWSGVYVIAFAAVVLWTIAEIIVFPALNSYVARAAAPSELGRYTGMIHATFAMARLLAPLGGTMILQRFGSQALWWSCTGLALLLSAAYALAEKVGRPASA